MGIPQMSLTLRVLARLLTYPDAELRRHLPAMAEALGRERALPARRQAEIEHLIDALASAAALDAEAAYVELFDRGRSTSLHLFEHVHGDSRDRGPAMIDLLQTYETAGLHLPPGELPDYLPVVLEFASTRPTAQARDFLRETAHIVRAVFTALVERDSAYASVLAAVLELAGERAEAVELPPEPALDDSWAEPEVFAGCTSPGQSRPGEAQPVHIVRKQPSNATGALA